MKAKAEAVVPVSPPPIPLTAGQPYILIKIKLHYDIITLNYIMNFFFIYLYCLTQLQKHGACEGAPSKDSPDPMNSIATLAGFESVTSLGAHLIFQPL